MASRARKEKSKKDKAFNAVEDNPKLLDLLEIAISTARKSIFIEALKKILPNAFAQTAGDPFALFTYWFSSYQHSDTLFPGIYAALELRQQYLWDNRFKKQQFINDIGLDWTEDIKSDFFSKVNSLCNVVKEDLISFLDQEGLC
jgi:hypothetical protein